MEEIQNSMDNNSERDSLQNKFLGLSEEKRTYRDKKKNLHIYI